MNYINLSRIVNLPVFLGRNTVAARVSWTIWEITDRVRNGILNLR